MMRAAPFFCLLIVALLALCLVHLSWGMVDINFWSPATEVDRLIAAQRIQKTISACLAGGALALGGLLMQTVFRNPMAGPSILGISTGASLGVSILLAAQIPISWFFLGGTTLAAFLGASLIFLIIAAVAARVRDMVSLLIVGIMISGVCAALISLLQSHMTEQGIQAFVFWGFGSFKAQGWPFIYWMAITLLPLMAYAWWRSKALNLLLLGAQQAKQLGLSVKRFRLLIMLLTCLLAAVVTAICGPIAFIGLIAPHIVRMLYPSTRHQVLIPASVLMGAVLALFSALLAQNPFMETVLPLNAITSLIGAPVVVYMILGRIKLSQGF